MENLIVGDRVEVINKGRMYSIYAELAKHMEAQHWISGTEAENGEIGHIIKLEPHLCYPERYAPVALVYLENRNVEILIGIGGLKKIEEDFKVGDKVKFMRHEKETGTSWELSFGLTIGEEGIVGIIGNGTIGVKYKFSNTRIHGYLYQFKKIPNTTPKYDVLTYKAIIDSIIHHEDNLNKLKTKKGEFRNNNHYFEIGDTRLFYGSGHCALCSKFGGGGKLTCEGCPLTIIGHNCNEPYSTWRKIYEAKTKEQAITAEENMVKVLKSLIEEYKIAEVKVDKYDELKARIEKITAWDENADNVLQEITDYRNPYWLSICCHNGMGSAILVKDINCKDGNENKASFTYENQCQKLLAFKKALIWLLDNSNIKKKVVDNTVKKHTK